MNHTTELSQEQIQRFAPSAFAGQPYEKQSDRYTFIPTSEVIDGMRGAGYVPVAADQRRTHTKKQFFTKHVLRFRPAESLEKPVEVGATVPEAILINSHDGTSAYKLFFGVFRFVCSNGMVVADSMFETVRIRHIGSVVQRAIEGTERIFEQSERVMGAIDAWQGITLLREEQISLAEAAHSLRFQDPSSTDVTPEMLLAARRYNDEGNSLWATFNRVQENVIKGIRARDIADRTRNRNTLTPRRVRGSRMVRGIDQDMRLNRALWSLGEKMAEIKAHS